MEELTEVLKVMMDSIIRLDERYKELSANQIKIVEIINEFTEANLEFIKYQKDPTADQ